MVTRDLTPVADAPLTSSRALRVAITRAADKALGLSLTVQSVSEELVALDDAIAAFPVENLYISMVRDGEVVGMMGVDNQLRAASIEMQTMGRLSKNAPPERAATGTDLMMLMPLCTMILAQIAETTLGSELEGWTKGVTLGAKFDSLRAAGLAIEDAEFRTMRLSIDLPVGERHAELLIMLPNHQLAPKVEAVTSTGVSWAIKMRAAVNLAPATLDAILYQVTMPIGVVDALKVGDVVPLLGATVGSVRLFAPDSVLVSEARLGQSGGKRAVRIQPAPEAMMRDLPAPEAQAVAKAS
jgi:flagellar motor switch protein FliM